jgi:uncharacterized membrane protein
MPLGICYTEKPNKIRALSHFLSSFKENLSLFKGRINPFEALVRNSFETKKMRRVNMFACLKSKLAFALILAFSVMIGNGGGTARAAEGDVSLFTPYTDIVVSPGESVNYSIEVINNTNVVQNAAMNVSGLGEGWTSELTSGGWKIGQISVKPKESQSLSLKITVPIKVNKGSYNVNVLAEGKASLPLTLRVAEEGSYRTELTSEQPNMEGNSDSTFTYSMTLKNSTPDQQTYALTTTAERGWDVQFKDGGKSVSSVLVEPGASKSVNVDVRPPQNIQEGTYKIPVKAASGNATAALDLEAAVRGSYKLELTTPTGLLSTDITAGRSKTVELQVSNKGSAPLTDLSLSANAPVDWEATFEPKEIRKLDAGQSTTVKATIKAANKAIAGDYVTSFTVSSPEASANATFRIAVETSMLWGWIGVLIIAAVLYFVYYLFQKYGRR